MAEQFSNEPMLDIYIFESTQNIEQLELLILETEKTGYTPAAINEIFRIMHTIKGSSAMMLFNNISNLSHNLEDVFYYLREKKPQNIDYSTLSDLVLECVDFIKVELYKIKNGDSANGDASGLAESIAKFLVQLKQNGQSESENTIEKSGTSQSPVFYISKDKTKVTMGKNTFKAVIFFEDGCEMENIRAYAVLNNMKDFADNVSCFPEKIIESDSSLNEIRKNGFKIFFRTDRSFDGVKDFFQHVAFLRDIELIEINQDNNPDSFESSKSPILESITLSVSDKTENNPVIVHQTKAIDEKASEPDIQLNTVQNIISVNVAKLDKLMDLVGEMVIAEAMVTQNPDILALEHEGFLKASRQLRKITNELQDTVMSIRMVPLITTFQKMHRIVRDMCKKLGKDVQLTLIGEETEVDKNIIEHISDPIMHLVRNSLDHGIESEGERIKKGKPPKGMVTLEATNAGSDVLIIIKDDGRGLNKEILLSKAKENHLLSRPEEEMTDREIYNLIFLPGFSTKDNVTEFSGRGVGMDVVTRNIETVGGSVFVESTEGLGTTIILKIPLTLAIIDGMNVRVGNSCYTIPITDIRESFIPYSTELITDPDGNEMIIVREQCYPILRLYEYFEVTSDVTNFEEGILVMVEQDGKTICLFADELLGQQQVVVKALPSYIKNKRKIHSLAGCTILGDGSISLIVDIGGFINHKAQANGMKHHLESG